MSGLPRYCPALLDQFRCGLFAAPPTFRGDACSELSPNTERTPQTNPAEEVEDLCWWKGRGQHIEQGKRFGAEEIIGGLPEAEVGLAQGQTVAHVARKLGISAQTYYCWRREYGGMKVDQAGGCRSWSAKTPG